ncbi:hypothetical protein [Anaerovibrio sp.]|nr:hypothetical protein [Anaerovibrio sp.]
MEEDRQCMCEEMIGFPVLACLTKSDKVISSLKVEELAALSE